MVENPVPAAEFEGCFAAGDHRPLQVGGILRDPMMDLTHGGRAKEMRSV